MAYQLLESVIASVSCIRDDPQCLYNGAESILNAMQSVQVLLIVLERGQQAKDGGDLRVL